MMILYGAEHHLLILSDKIDADEHGHTFLQLTISLEDELEIEVEGQVVGCSGILIDSNVVHRLQGTGRPLLLLLMDRTSDMAASFKRYIGERKYAVLPTETVRTMSELVQSEYLHVKDTDSYIAFLEQLTALMGVERTKTAITDSRIREFIQLVKDCTDSEHSVSLYARKLSLSNSRLSHLFKENTGISLSGYMLLHKLQKASYLIFQGLSITDAAMTAGFDSPSHLAATSKRLLGMNAKDIRKDSVFLQVSCLHERYT